MFHPKDTRWEVNAEGELICQRWGDPAWRTVAVWAGEFPLTANKVAMLMNDAFESGRNARLDEIQMALGIKK